jgi:hypothetical protein
MLIYSLNSLGGDVYQIPRWGDRCYNCAFMDEEKGKPLNEPVGVYKTEKDTNCHLAFRY